MKKFSKIAAVVALMLVVCLSFTGCGNLGNAIISALSLDVTVDDPALIKVEDILDKTVKTESVKSGDFTYTLYTDNTACITGYTGSNPVVSIPAEIDGTKVVGLENKALKSSSTLKELILPDSVEAIGNYAAMYCDSLEKVTIGKNIKHIGISAFEGSQENAYTGPGPDVGPQASGFRGDPQEAFRREHRSLWGTWSRLWDMGWEWVHLLQDQVSRLFGGRRM